MPASRNFDWKHLEGTDEEFRNRQIQAFFHSKPTRPDDYVLGKEQGTNFPVYVHDDTLKRHAYIVGASGAGKTTLVKQLIEQHIERHEGFAVIDPKGGLLEHIKERIACAYHRTHDEELLDRLVVVDPKHPTHTATFNPLEPLPNTEPDEQAAELVSTFHKIWPDAWGGRMEDILRNSCIAASEAGLSLIDIQRFLTDADFRASAMRHVKHLDAQDFFKKGGDYDVLTRTSGGATTVLGPVSTKLRNFSRNKKVSQLLASPHSSFNFRDIIDNRKILVIALEGLRDLTWLLSALFMSKITLAAFSRIDIPEDQRVPFFLYVDEFAKFANEDFEDTLTLARSFGLSIIMAHQNYDQIPTKLRAAAIGNSQLRVAFRLQNPSDAAFYARQIFKYDEDEVKRERPLQSGATSYTYRSAGEQRDRLAQTLYDQPDLHCYVQDMLHREVTSARVEHIPYAFQELGMSKSEATAYINSLSLGSKYLVERSKIQQRMDEQRTGTFTIDVPPAQDSLTDKQRVFLEYLVDNPSTSQKKVFSALEIGNSQGSGIIKSLLDLGLMEPPLQANSGDVGRPPKLLNASAKAYKLLDRELPEGEGGVIHRQVQTMVEECAKALGYRTAKRKPIANGGHVDVHLENQQEKVAVEVAIGSRPGRELAHIRNCLDEGYDRIFTLFLDADKLARTQERLADSCTKDELRRVTLLPVQNFASFL